MEGRSLLFNSEDRTVQLRKGEELGDEEALRGWVQQASGTATPVVTSLQSGPSLLFDFGYKRVRVAKASFREAPLLHCFCLSAFPCYYAGALFPFRDDGQTRASCLAELLVLVRTATFAMFFVIALVYIFEVCIGGGFASLEKSPLVGPHKCVLFMVKGNVSVNIAALMMLLLSPLSCNRCI